MRLCFKRFARFFLCKTSLLATILPAVLLSLPLMALAQETTQPNGIDDLYGIEPSADYVAGSYNAAKPTGADANTKVLCFYNVGTKQFLSIGGRYGTHATLNSTPYAIWLESTDTDGTYWIDNLVGGSGTGHHMGINTNNSTCWMDRNKDGGWASHFKFEKSKNWTETNRVYLLKAIVLNNDNTETTTTKYISAFPDNKENNTVSWASGTWSGDKYPLSEWKIITKGEYYELAKANPANMASLVDFSFLMESPAFRVNDTNQKYWNIDDTNGGTASAKVRLGDNTMFCTFANRGASGQGHFTDESGKATFNGTHQQNYGQYFYCYSIGSQKYRIYQDIKIHKAGWYVLRCNGFTTQVETADKAVTPKASLFAGVVKDGKLDLSTLTASSLNIIGLDEATKLTASENGCGAGLAFYKGQYENQVQLCVDDPKDGAVISSDNPVTLRVGFIVDAYTDASQLNAADITAVDNFKLYYAGPRRNPELILDEDSHDMLYITEANDTYTNSVLHLNRHFNDHQWNSLVLPVKLTAGQLKRTYGDAVKVAKLDRIEGNVVFFVTEETSNDDENIIEAFTPYIIYPPVVDTTSPAYTAPHFYTNEKDADDNSQFLDKGYASTSEESEALTKTIPANHYTITMVSLDRELLKKHVDVTEVDGKYTWRTNTNVVTTGSEMTCYATLAKTYYDSNDVKAELCAENQKGIIAGRDNLAGDYVMREGKLVQVPHDKQYGLKGFRCWFELADPSSSSKLSLNIDGVEDRPTGVNDIVGDEALFTTRARGIDGVFSLDGQRVRTSNDTRSLPKGIYISNGRKVVVR